MYIFIVFLWDFNSYKKLNKNALDSKNHQVVHPRNKITGPVQVGHEHEGIHTNIYKHDRKIMSVVWEIT